MKRKCSDPNCQEGPNFQPAEAYCQHEQRWAAFDTGTGRAPYYGLCLNHIAEHNMEAESSGGDISPIMF